MSVDDKEELRRKNLYKSVWDLISVHRQKSSGVNFISKNF